MTNVVDGPFKGKVRGEFRASAALEIDEESTSQFTVFKSILDNYTVGLNSKLFLFIQSLGMKGEHVTEFLRLKDEKNVIAHVLNTSQKLDHSKELIRMPGYLDINPDPVFYPITTTTIDQPELAGYRHVLKPFSEQVKGPTIMHSVDGYMIGIEILYNTIDDTMSN